MLEVRSMRNFKILKNMHIDGWENFIFLDVPHLNGT